MLQRVRELVTGVLDLAERHLPVAARRFPRAYPLEPGLWRNLLDDDRAFA